MRRRLFPALALVLALAACNDMARQPRAGVYRSSPLFADASAMQPPPPDAVARDEIQWDRDLAVRPPMTPALLARGRERFGIYCQPCHDASGHGRGIVPARGFPQPPTFHQEPLLGAPSRRFVDVITHGYGVMYSYADRIPPHDRWAIAAYIRALQLSQHARAADLPAQDRARLEAADGR
jgi:mono/diheme cytochrome c family protein